MIDVMKQYEVGQILKRRRTLAEHEIKVKKKEVVKPTSNELLQMGAMLNNIHDLNRDAHASTDIKQANLVRRIQNEKDKLNRALEVFTQFSYEVPVSHHYVTKVYEYNKIDGSIQKIIDELDSVRMVGIEEIEKRKKLFGDFG